MTKERSQDLDKLPKAKELAPIKNHTELYNYNEQSNRQDLYK